MDRAAKIRFEGFEVDLQNSELRNHDKPVKLQLQPFKVLALLVSRAGQVVSRDEIRRHVWDAETFVDYEQGLNYCIRQIRTALGERPGKAYIETLPRRGYRFIAPVEQSVERDARSAGKVMLAVLPLENLSGNPEQEYFVDGLTDEIIAVLGGLSPHQLGVIARTSAMQYKRTTKRVDQIGRELDVEYVIEGAVRRENDRVRITAQLIRVRDETHIWANTYERRLQDVLLLQSELALAIAGAVRVHLGAAPSESVQRRVNPDAYEACLRARFFWNRRSREDLYRALEIFARSIEQDPEYAPGFAGLADTYLVLLDYRYLPAREALALATAAAVNALRLDERLADAHTSLGHAKLHTLDWEGSEREFRRAIQLGPNYAVAHFYYANLLVGRGRFDEAIAEGREAIRLDPVSMLAEANLAILYYAAGRYDEALEACRKAIQMEPGLARPYDDLGRILLEKRAWGEATAALEKAVTLSQRSVRCLSGLGYGYAVAGNKKSARKILEELMESSQSRHVGSFDLALVYAGLEERDQAIQWLERSLEERESHAPFLHVDPRLASLRDDARFQALLKRAGIERV